MVGRRALVQSFGETPLEAVAEQLVIEDQPQPVAHGARDVVVAIERAAVGWVDLLMMSGQYQHMAAPPYCPGLEYSGRVVAVGSEVDDLSIGDDVVADALLTGPRSRGDHRRYGGFASYAVAPREALLRKPDALTHDQACHFLSSYATAYHCLIARGQLRAGESVLIMGASGATGLAAVHLAKRIGATVIATGRSEEKLAVVESQGADHVIATRRDGDGIAPFRDEVKALSDGRGVDVVYDAVGGDLSLEAIRCTRFGARFLVVGWAATPFVARGKGKRGAPRANVIPTNLIMMKGLDVLGCPAAISAHHDPSLTVERRQQLLSWIESGELVPHVGATYPFDALREALHAKWESRHVGAVVLAPSQTS